MAAHRQQRTRCSLPPAQRALLRHSLCSSLSGWQAWLAHVKYFKSMTASSFTLADIKRLDAEIQEHQELYASVPGAHFMPKHHFARHVAKDIVRAGPPRRFWCFPFEAYYRRVKQWAEHSNRKGELMHIAKMLSLQRAVELSELAEQ